MSTRRTFLQLGTVVGAGTLIRWQLDPTSGRLFNVVRAFASVQTPQTPLPGSKVAKFMFTDALPTFVGKRIDDAFIEVEMLEFQQKVLPNQMYAGLPAPFNAGTYVWGYQVGAGAGPSWPGRTVEAQRGRTTTIKYVNSLPLNPVLRQYLTIDQTIHWADPLKQMGSFSAYSGPIPDRRPPSRRRGHVLVRRSARGLVHARRSSRQRLRHLVRDGSQRGRVSVSQ